MDQVQKIREISVQKKEEIVVLLQELVKINSINPSFGGPGENEIIKYLISFCESLGLSPRIHTYLDTEHDNMERKSIIIIDDYGKENTLWFIAHVDTVATGPLHEWTHPPLEGKEHQGKIYGRGSEDNKQSLAAALGAYMIAKSSGLGMKYNIGFAFVADEEAGNDYGINKLVEENIFKESDLVVVPDHGNEKGDIVEIAEKSIVWIKLTIEGKQGHASRPNEGINAYLASAHMVTHLHKVLHEKFNARDKIFAPEYSTFTPTKHELNVESVNIMPGYEAVYFDCRVLPQYPLDEVMEVFREEAEKVAKEHGVKFNCEKVIEMPAPPKTNEKSEVVKLLVDAISRSRNIKPRLIGIGGGTCAAPFREKGIPAVVWCTIDRKMHQIDEYASVDNLIEDCIVFALMMVSDVENK